MLGLTVHIVSGGSCRTANQVMRACLSQFAPDQIRVESHPSVRSPSEVFEIVLSAAKEQAAIFHSLVDPAVRSALSDSAIENDVPCVDLLGPAMSVLGERLRQAPIGQPGLLYELHREQFDRLDAVDFTMAHDDGNRLYDLHEAEVVLVGVSRVSKSVTCFYLASRGVRAANVPLIAGQPISPELLLVPVERVFGLTMNAAHLSAIRQARLDRISARDVPDYASIRELNRELRWARQVFSDHGWAQIDVSYKATEEIASQIIDTLRH